MFKSGVGTCSIFFSFFQKDVCVLSASKKRSKSRLTASLRLTNMQSSVFFFLKLSNIVADIIFISEIL